MTDRLPVVVVGAGAMGRHWLRVLRDNHYARTVGLVDLDLDLAGRALIEEGIEGVKVGSDVVDVARESGAQAVINVTVPNAHRPVNESALRAGLPVLCEKPLAPTLAGALSQVALADVTEGLLMVSQSRRYFTELSRLQKFATEVGALGALTQEFFHADHEPGFREEMDHPLLVDMSIHHFDAARFVTGQNAVSVTCTSWNPAWSWYRGHASATADFELESGAHFTYSGSRCTPGLTTSWNAAWRVQGERGAASWDGDGKVVIEAPTLSIDVDAHEEEVAGALADFVTGIRANRTPQNEVRQNVHSLAMVEGAILSSLRGGERVIIADMLERAYTQAIDVERAEDVRKCLESWGSAASGLDSDGWGSLTANAIGEAE